MRRELMKRLGLGAAAGVFGLGALALAVSALGGQPWMPVGAWLEDSFGFGPGLGLEVLVTALWGMELFAAPLIWRWEPLPVWGRTALHFTVTVLGFGLWALPHAVSPGWDTLALLAGLAAGLYLVAWAVNWLGSRSDVDRIRAGLGLPEEVRRGGVFQVRPVLPYLLMTAVVLLVLPPVLRLLDPADVPVFTGLLYPFVVLPFACFVTGRDIGKRLGVALVHPLACGILTVPGILLLYNSSAVFQVWIAAAFALAGNLLGALMRKKK